MDFDLYPDNKNTLILKGKYEGISGGVPYRDTIASTPAGCQTDPKFKKASATRERGRVALARWLGGRHHCTRIRGIDANTVNKDYQNLQLPILR